MAIERYSPIWGGAENQLRQLNAYLRQSGHEPVVLTRRWSRALPAVDVVEGILVRRVGLPIEGRLGSAAFSAALLWHLARSLRGGGVIHSHGAAALGAICALAASWTRSRCVVKIATAGKIPRLQRTVLGRLVLRQFKRADVVVCLSEEIHEELRSIGFPDNRIARVPNAVDTARFHPLHFERRSEVRDALGIGERDPVVVFSGRLVQRKGPDILLDAWSGVADKHPSAWLVLLGSGDGQPDSVEQDLHRAARQRKLRNVIFMGATDRPEDLLGSAELFVLPSFQEGFPNALLEAMAAGLASVASRIGGVVDLVNDGSDALLVDAGDAGALADNINALLSDPARRDEMGAQARALVLRHFDLSDVFSTYEGLYRGADASAKPQDDRTKQTTQVP